MPIGQPLVLTKFLQYLQLHFGFIGQSITTKQTNKQTKEKTKYKIHKRLSDSLSVQRTTMCHSGSKILTERNFVHENIEYLMKNVNSFIFFIYITWYLIILGLCFLSSIIHLWLLLQPRSNYCVTFWGNNYCEGQLLRAAVKCCQCNHLSLLAGSSRHGV